jgi:hypothetical protein
MMKAEAAASRNEVFVAAREPHDEHGQHGGAEERQQHRVPRHADVADSGVAAA